LHESAGLVGKIVPELQLKFGFTQEVAIFAGGADNACAALGAGIIKEGLAMASIGTSGVFLSYEADETVDYQGKLHLFNHSVKDKLYGMGVTLAAGNSLSWFRDTFAPEEDFATLLADVG
ncbi:xylulokinase, partial [Escherichia coli]